MTGASAAARAIFAQREQLAEPRSLQELHSDSRQAAAPDRSGVVSEQ
jgi:hypothetical protein